MVEGHIRWSAIQSYSKTMGIHPKAFKKVIRAMDGAYLSHQSKEK